MITPTIYDFHSSDLPEVATWQPAANEPIDYWLTLDIGSGGEGTDEFQVRIASPDALIANGPSPCRATIAISRNGYSFAAVQLVLEQTVASCARESWEDCALALSRYFLWEYEDHQFVD